MRKMDRSIYGSYSEKLPETIAGNVSRIAKKFGIKMVILHGSILAGKVHSNSDVDIAIILDKPEITTKRYSIIIDAF